MGEIVSFFKGTGYSKADLRESGTPIILYGRLYTNYKTVINEVDTFAEAKSGSVYSTGGEVIVPASGETAEDISIASVVEKSGVLLGGDLNIIKPSKDFNSAFLAISISNGKPHDDMAKMAQGKSVVHLHNSDLEKIDLLYPSHNEQVRISSYFANLDNLITLHQRKFVYLFSSVLKKSPKLTNSWEQRKFEDMGSVAMCKRIFKEQTTDKGDVPFYKIGTFGGEPDAFITRELFEEYKSKFPYPRIGDILISASGTIGRTVEYTGKDEYFQDSNIVWLKHDERIDNAFLKCLYSIVKWSGVEGSTIKRLYNDTLLKTEIKLPGVEEQQAIGTFFCNLDNLITLHQRNECIKLLKEIIFMVFNKEADFENALIKVLGEKGWEKEVIKYPTEKDMIDNWAKILYENNRSVDRLNDYPLTDGEMQQVIEQVNSLKTPLKLNGFINGKTISIVRDNEDDKEHFGKEVSLKIYDRREIATGSSRYQIVQQPQFPTKSKVLNDRRGDLMLLINGMPVIHIELKKSGVPVSQACRQIEKYAHEGIFTGLFSLVQIFVAMNPDETLYFANPGPEGKFNPNYYFHWADFYNESVNEWKEIADKLLSMEKCIILQLTIFLKDIAKN